EFAYAVLNSGRDDKILGLLLLQDQPLRFDVIAGVAPIALGVHVAEIEGVLQPQFDTSQGASDLAGDESLAANRRFVVEQNAVAGVHAVGFAVVHRNPVTIEFGHGIGAARVEGSSFFLRDFLDQAVEFRRAGLVEAGLLLKSENANGFENS